MNALNEPSFDDDQQFEQIIELLSNRFATYGYRRKRTPAFERYDLYEKVRSSVDRKAMMKVIDATGEVLVLRPDVTIPITQELSHDYQKLTSERRYYYVQEVFRQTFDEQSGIVRTHAGVEYFCQQSPESDAETIALALQIMDDLAFQEKKIEIGHASFFQQLVQKMNLTQQNIDHIKQLIHRKNIVELAPYLQQLDLTVSEREAIAQIPFLYGSPERVAERIEQLGLHDELHETISDVLEVCRLLQMYGWQTEVVLDFSLMNRMDYYSGILFQGYVERYGKPVLMGGRYDSLGNQFGAKLPAIGFASEIESFVEAIGERSIVRSKPLDMKIVYTDERAKEAIQLATSLREQGRQVVTFPKRLDQVTAEMFQIIVYLNQEETVVEGKQGAKDVESLQTVVENFVRKDEIVWK